MKFNDTVWGAVLLAFAGTLLWYVQRFPSIPGQQVGPVVMPSALAVGLGVCGLILFVKGLRARGADAAPWVSLPPWFASPPQVVGFAVLVGVNLLYLMAVDKLGFVIVGVIYLSALMWVLRVRPSRALPIALVMTLMIHYCFYKLLKVPLPWGLLQPVAW